MTDVKGYTPKDGDVTILSCGHCGKRPKPLSKRALGQLGVPWYCDHCDSRVTRFTTYNLDELPRHLKDKVVP